MIRVFKLALLTTLITISGFASAEIDAGLLERAKQGDAKAQYNLGFMYYIGDGVPKDKKEAVKWFRLAAEQGHAYAQYRLGNMYDKGRGVPEDDKEAMKWFRLAAEQGIANAQNNLGNMYATGQGVPEDYVIAYAWVNLAGANGTDVTRVKEFLERKMSPEDKSEAQKLTGQLMKDFPDVY